MNIIYFTGTACWHYLRKFSLTSSQAHTAFLALIPKYKDDASFVKVAEYLYGPEWASILKIVDDTPNNANDANVQNETADEDATNGTDDHLNPETLKNFVKAFPIPDEDDEAQTAALNFIESYVVVEEDEDRDDHSTEEGVVIESEDEAKTIVRLQLNARERKTVLDLLAGHITHDAYRKKTTTKDLIFWLQQPNSIRNFIFYKSQGLKDLMAARGIELTTGSKTMANMIEALAGTGNVEVRTAPESNEQDGVHEEAMSPEETATRKVLEKSFLPHQKGQAREYCSLGHRLEKPILQSWITMAEDTMNYPALGGIEVCGAYTAGLAAKKGETYAKDSIDFILLVKDPDDDEEDAEIKTWGFEVKGRVTPRTAAAEERRIRAPDEKNVRVSDDAAYDIIADPGELFQVIQHAYVYDLDAVVLAIGDSQSELIRSAIIDFSTEFRRHFGNVLRKMKDITLDWAYMHPAQSNGRRQVVEIPERIFNIADKIKHINGSETLQGTANVWYSLACLPKPFPSLVRLIPAIYAFWNAVKSGSDTTTKIMDDCLLRIPKSYLNAETVAVNRLLSINLVVVHRLSQTFSAKEDLGFYSCLHSYRKDASQRLTFHSNLLKCRHFFQKAIERLEQVEQEGMPTMEQDTLSPPLRQRRQNPIRHVIDGIHPERATFGATLLTKTPTKISSRTRAGTAPPEVEAMVTQCTGTPMKFYNPTDKKRRQFRCSICEKKTVWRCIGCKRWLCMERKKVTDGGEALNGIYIHNVQGQALTFQKSCFHVCHEAAWKERSDQ